jgi:hypothetical protein
VVTPTAEVVWASVAVLGAALLAARWVNYERMQAG